MVAATDSASKALQGWFFVSLGLGLCLGQTGCAKLKSASKTTPVMLGAAAPFSKSPADPSADLYAQEVGKGAPNSRALLAQEKAQKRARDGRSRPGDERLLAQASGRPDEVIAPIPVEGTGIALQAPVSVPARGAAEVAPAAAQVLAAPAAAPSSAHEKNDAKTLTALISDSQGRLASMTSYQVPISRQERVGSALLPAEDILLSIRREPRAVRIEWPDGPSKGREVIYSATEHDGLMHVKMPESVIPVPPLALATDSPMVKRTSRHPITEAGYETIVEKLDKTIAEAANPGSPLGKVSYGGLENPGSLERPSHKIVRVTPSGETWVVFIDPTTKLPVLLEGKAGNGDLLERYQFGEPKVDPTDLTAADAFDPTKRWGQSGAGGLLSRIARAGGAGSTETPPR